MIVVKTQFIRRLVTLASEGVVHRYFYLSGLSAGITFGAPIILHELAGFEEKDAVGLALVAAFIVNFLVARSYVFRSNGAMLPQLVRFASSSLVFRGGEYLAFLLLHSYLGMFYVLAVGIVLAISFVLKFLFYRVFVFGTTRTGNRNC